MSNLSALKYLIVAACGGLGAFSISDIAFPQIIPDNTLGLERSQINSVDAVTEQISGGALSGTNLFHSFLEFNIDDGQRIYFAPLPKVENILSRVTGSNPSNVLGLLGIEGSANLFLLNPNGIAFGPNAALDIEGSFLASTTEGLTFADGSTFSATNPEYASLLTIKVPLGLQYGPYPEGSTIDNVGALAVGQDLTLLADQLNLQGQLVAGENLTLQATDLLRLWDTSTLPFLAAAGNDLVIQGDNSVDIFILNHPDSSLISGGDLLLRSDNPVGSDAHYWSGGDFRVEDLAGEVGDLKSPYDPIIRSFGDVFIDEYEGTSLHILAGGAVVIGTARITAPEQGLAGIDFLQETVELSDGTLVDVDGSAQPTLDVRAGVDPSNIGTPPLTTLTGFNIFQDRFSGNNFVRNTPSSGDIVIGDVLISEPDALVLLTNQYEPSVAPLAGSIVVTDAGALGTGIDVGSRGKGGSIFLDSRNNIVVLDSAVSTSSFGEAGDIVIIAEDTVQFDGFITDPTVEAFGAGGAFSLAALEQPDAAAPQAISGGDIKIKANDLFLTNGASIFTSVVNDGTAGNILIDVAGTVSFEGVAPIGIGGALSGAFLLDSGNSDNQSIAAGNITIVANNLDIANGAALNTVTANAGNAGDIIINVADTVRVDGGTNFNGAIVPTRINSGIVSNDLDSFGGNIQISAGNIEVTNGAQLIAETLGTAGNSGNVSLNARETVQLSNLGVVSSSLNAGTRGRAGDINIAAADLQINNAAFIVSVTGGMGNSGNITIDVTDTVQLDDLGLVLSGVVDGAEGDGGDIRLSARNLDVAGGSQINTETFGIGDAGRVLINVADTARFDGVLINTNTGLPVFSTASTSVRAGAIGNGGDVRLSANNLVLTNGAQLRAATAGVGNAGNIVLNIVETVRLDEANVSDEFPFPLTSRISSQVDSDGQGRGGDIRLSARNLDVQAGSALSAATLGIGDSGDVIINVVDTARFSGGIFSETLGLPLLSRASTDVGILGQGVGGDLQLTANTLEVTNGSQLSANNNLGVGDAGNVILNVQGTARFDGAFRTADFIFPSQASTRVVLATQGTGGDVRIVANDLELTNGARLRADTSSSSGDAGNVVLRLQERLFANDATIETVSSAASGGSVIVDAGDIRLLGDTNIISFVQTGSGAGGDILLTADSVIAFDDSDILAFAQDGSGGNIILNTPAFFGENYRPSPEGIDPFTLDGNDRVDINASGAISGGVTLPDVRFIQDSLTELPDTLVKADELISSSCIVDNGLGGSLNVFGQEGAPEQPDSELALSYATGTVQATAENHSLVDNPPVWQPDQPVVEPQAMLQLPGGRLVISRSCADR